MNKKNQRNREAEIVVRNLKDAVGVGKDYELADYLEIRSATVSGWKKRPGGVPFEYIKKVSEDKDVPIGNLLTGGGSEMPDSVMVEMFLQMNAKLEKMDSKIDDLAGKCKTVYEELDALKKALGESAPKIRRAVAK